MARQVSRSQPGQPQPEPRNAQALRVRVRVWINLGTTPLLGPGRVSLLEAIAATGSISAAGRSLGLSYRKAWTQVHAMNDVSRQPLVERETGGRGGGGARLTPQGRQLVQAFRILEGDLARQAQRAERQIARELGQEPAPCASAQARSTPRSRRRGTPR